MDEKYQKDLKNKLEILNWWIDKWWRGNIRDTKKRDLVKRMDRTLLAVHSKPKPRDAQLLFKNFAELFFDNTMPKCGQGRKRNMGDLRVFLNWAVLEKKYLGVEWLPLTSKQYSKNIGVVLKGKKKSRVI